MQNIVEGLKVQRHRDSTKATYYSVWRTFNQFYIKLDVKPPTWEERLVLFVGYLVQQKLKATTVNSYISAIKAVLKQDGVQLNKDRYILNSLVKACKYVNYQVRTRLPIQKRLCAYLIHHTENYFRDHNQPYLACLYTALFASAYYGMLRIGELTTGTHPIRVTDVHVGENKNKVLFVLRTLKTHWLDSKLQFVKLMSVPLKNAEQHMHIIPSMGEWYFCPYELVERFISYRPKYKNVTDPFFVFSDHSPVTAHNARSTLKLMLTQMRLDSDKYGMHSFRIGRSVDMFNALIEISMIRKIGHWRSNIVYSYLNA